jgi:hypothetical protein
MDGPNEKATMRNPNLPQALMGCRASFTATKLRTSGVALLITLAAARVAAQPAQPWINIQPAGDGSNLLFQLTTEPSVFYTFQQSTDLMNWGYAAQYFANDTSLSWTNPLSSSDTARFFRVSVNVPVSADALVSQTNCAGAAAGFSTVVYGTGPFGYQWFKDGNALANQTNSSFSIPSIGGGDVGTYSVQVSGACNSVTNSATLSVNAPVSADALVPQTNCAGAAAGFSTVAYGTGPLDINGSRMATRCPTRPTVRSRFPSLAAVTWGPTRCRSAARATA